LLQLISWSIHFLFKEDYQNCYCCYICTMIMEFLQV